mgnify:FL=1
MAAGWALIGSYGDRVSGKTKQREEDNQHNYTIEDFLKL